MTLHTHMYYYDPKVLDIEVMRREALQASIKNDEWDKPKDVTIHYHKRGDRCENKKHEDWKAQS